ncbi:LysR family transcriptional regulator [Pyxidicoccus xibeiensis]|uniref:LysR family transcriptional regulator n=1 Tax=Pyxidicoccus xibeiensis TaxID=2906759 RepID=UPI0020A6FE7A|nr:LysR family transcriptional regulator [Pyxidicoccus xibeiensis]MCP3141783.1 LysR family transcriptional regulator [Pyxidicoccus xibeiensis]
MARLDVNRSGEMEVFVRVVELGGFSAAARAYRMTPSAVSKLVARLEARLGARLINRSTRALQLTPEGVTFYERSVRVLAELDEAERGAATSAEPQGRLRVSASVPFGTHFLLPLVPEFLALHPAVCLDLVLTDTVVDLLEARTDVAIRHGPLKSSDLVARKLGEPGMVVVGSPAYLKRHGTPKTPRELEGHNRIGFGFARAVDGWPFVDRGVALMVAAHGNAQVSNGEALRQLVLAGLGLGRLARFQVKDDLAAGRLVPLLEDYNPGDKDAVHAVFMGAGGQLPSRVRAFLDFLAEKVRM